jgi:hypothetical protein
MKRESRFRKPPSIPPIGIVQTACAQDALREYSPVVEAEDGYAHERAEPGEALTSHRMNERQVPQGAFA